MSWSTRLRHLPIALGLALAASPAVAGSVTLAPPPDQQVCGGSVSSSISLIAGRDYALRIGSGLAGTATLRYGVPSGPLALTFPVVEQHLDNASGHEFRPARSGVYYVKITFGQPGCVPGTPYVGNGSGPPWIRWEFDCAGALRTQCSLDVGSTRRSSRTFSREYDYFRTELKRGVKYDVTAKVCGAALVIRDAQGKRLVSTAPCDGYGVMPPLVIHGFSPPTTGTYYISVEGHPCDTCIFLGPYFVSLKSQ